MLSYFRGLLATLAGTVSELLDSKGVVAGLTAAVVSALVRIAGHYHVALSPEIAGEVADRIVAFGLVVVGGLAVRDVGKGKVEAQQAAAASPAGGPVVPDMKKQGGAP